MIKRTLALFLCGTVLISCLCVPSYADSVIDLSSVTDIFDWALQKGTDIGSFAKFLFLDHSTCIYAPGANKRHNFVKQHTAVDGKTGNFYICEYCGKSAGEVGEEAYQEQVSTLPAPGYNSAGRLIWQPTYSNITSVVHRNIGQTLGEDVKSNALGNGFVKGPMYYYYSGKGNAEGSFSISFGGFPMAGSYYYTDSISNTFRFTYDSGAVFANSKKYSAVFFRTISSSIVENNVAVSITVSSAAELPESGLCLFEVFCLFLKLFLIQFHLVTPTTSTPAPPPSQAATTAS